LSIEVFVYFFIFLCYYFYSEFIFNFNNMDLFIVFLVFAFIFFLSSLKQINQYERGVKFTMGRFSEVMEPGWKFLWPIFQTYKKVDIRVKAVDVPDQRAITRDNVPVTVNAVLYYKIIDASKAIIEVENFYYAVSQYAQTTMRNIAGETSLDELLTNRDQIAERIREIVDKETDAWGLKVNNVELKDIILPESMERTIAKQAEAEREKRAVIINAQGELAAAENLSNAAKILSSSDGALHLRTLQSINDISSDQSNTIVFVTPVEILKAFESFKSKKE